MPEFPTAHFTGEEAGLFSFEEIRRLMQSECERATRYGYPVTSMMIAVDRLDQLGDLYGFESRDAILSEVSSVLRKNTRESDYLGCMVGSHFLAIFPHTKEADGPGLAGRLLRDTSQLLFDAGSSTVHVSLSIGLVYRKAGEKVEFGALCSEVRRAMDRALAEGGSRYQVYTPPASAQMQVAVPDLGDSLQEIGSHLESLLNSKVEAIFASMGQALPDFGGRLKEVLQRAVQKMEAAHAQMKADHAEQVGLLERRLTKLSATLENTEGKLKGVVSGQPLDSGVASVYRTVQGLSDVEDDLHLKEEMMVKIFEANVELRNELSQQEPSE